MNGRAAIQLTLAMVLTMDAAVAAASPDERLLTQLADTHLLVGGARIVGTVDAQVRLSIGSGWRTADYQDDWGRRERRLEIRNLLLRWDTSFGAGDSFELGARLQGAYTNEDDQQRIGPEVVSLGARYAALDGTDGPWLTIGAAGGKTLYHPGDTTLEVDVVLGLQPHPRIALDFSAFLATFVAAGLDTELTGGLAGGPRWGPWEWLDIALDLSGQVHSVREQEDLGWELTGAVDLGFALGGGHELSVGMYRTLAGALVEERTFGMVSWTLRWTTQGGFLRLDRGVDPASDS